MRSYDQTVKDFRAQQREKAITDARNFAGAAVAAAISVEHLTGDPHWDRYQAMLQGALDGAEASRAALLEKLADPMLTDPAEVARVRASAGIQAVRAEVLRNVIALPADLKRDGEKARDLLARLEAPDGEADAG